VDLANDDRFYRSFIISLGAHALLIAAAALGARFLPEAFRNTDIEIVRASVRVDVVGMPKFTVQELKDMQKEANLPREPETAKGEAAPAKVEAPDVVKEGDLVIPEEGKEKKKPSFLATLSDYSNKKIAPAPRDKGKKTGTADKTLAALVIEGNRLSQGSALVGDYSDGPDSPFASYVQTLPGAIRPNWKLPGYLLEKDLRARIRIFLSASGKLLKLEVVESSGDADFDARAEKAVRDTSFPQPAPEVGARLTSSGIILGFPL
jgi:TonB family protein